MTFRIFLVLFIMSWSTACRETSEDDTLPIPEEYYGEYTAVSMTIDGEVDLNQDGISNSSLYAESRWLYNNYKTFEFHIIDKIQNPNFPYYPFGYSYPIQVYWGSSGPYPSGFDLFIGDTSGYIPKYNGNFITYPDYPNIKRLYHSGADSFTLIKDIKLVNYSDTNVYELTIIYKKD